MLDPKAITIADIAELFEVGDRTVRNWIVEPGFPDSFEPTIRGKGKAVKLYRLLDVIKWFQQSAVDKYSASLERTPENEQEAKYRKTLAEAQLKEQELAVRNGILVEAAEVERVWTQALSRFRDGLLRSGQSFAQDVLALPKIDFNSVKDAYDINSAMALEELTLTQVPDEAPESVTESL